MNTTSDSASGLPARILPARILIVDDTPSMQNLVSRILTADGFVTDTADNGRDAFDKLSSHPFDLVVTDIVMPVMDGLELTRKVVREFSCDVIIMTGVIDRFSYDQVIPLGASDYIQKPFTPEEMVLRVRRVVRERQMKADAIRFHKELAQAQRLESIGQLAAGIAHEINTPIQYIGDNTVFIKETFQELAPLISSLADLFKTVRSGQVDQDVLIRLEQAFEAADFDYIRQEMPVAIDQTLEGVNRIKEIIRAMKAFSHPGGQEHVLSDLNQCIENTVTISKNEWKYVAQVTLDLDPELPRIPCNPGELNQVFLNLIVNASHAIEEKLKALSGKKGEIRITTRKKGAWIEIQISDTGTGIPDTVVDKVFHPFFTTKEIGRGTGQGLAISRSVVVNRHQGEITVRTRPGQGSCFCIRLPASRPETPAGQGDPWPER